MSGQRYAAGRIWEVTDGPVKKGDRVVLGVSREFTVIGVYPYLGKYKEWFKYTVRIALPNSRSGYLEYCI